MLLFYSISRCAVLFHILCVFSVAGSIPSCFCRYRCAGLSSCSLIWKSFGGSLKWTLGRVFIIGVNNAGNVYFLVWTGQSWLVGNVAAMSPAGGGAAQTDRRNIARSQCCRGAVAILWRHRVCSTWARRITEQIHRFTDSTTWTHRSTGLTSSVSLMMNWRINGFRSTGESLHTL